MTTITPPPSPPSTSKRVVLIALVAAVVLGLTAGSLLNGQPLMGKSRSSKKAVKTRADIDRANDGVTADDAAAAGPVHAAFSRLSYTGGIGQKVAFGAIELRNSGAAEAVIESVTPIDVPIGLDVHNVGAIDTRELDEPIGAKPDLWVPDVPAAAGTRLAPHAATSAQIVFVVAGTRPGRFAFARTAVRYRVGEQAHTLTVPAGVDLTTTRRDAT